MNSPEACRRRLLRYVVPVILLSVVFNIPKFMEAEIHWGNGPPINGTVLPPGSFDLSGVNSTIVNINGTEYLLVQEDEKDFLVEQIYEEIPTVGDFLDFLQVYILTFFL